MSMVDRQIYGWRDIVDDRDFKKFEGIKVFS